MHAGAKAHTWMPVYDRSSKLRLTMEVRSVGMTGSSPMHTLRTRESKYGAPARALLRVRLSSWVQKVASKADKLGQVSFSACSRLQPLHTCHFTFSLNPLQWSVEPIVTHQTSWLESTGVWGARQNQAGQRCFHKMSMLVSTMVCFAMLLHLAAVTGLQQ